MQSNEPQSEPRPMASPSLTLQVKAEAVTLSNGTKVTRLSFQTAGELSPVTATVTIPHGQEPQVQTVVTAALEHAYAKHQQTGIVTAPANAINQLPRLNGGRP